MSDAPSTKPAATDKPKAKPKPPKPEDKPFERFITEDYLPALRQELDRRGGGEGLSLEFGEGPMPVVGSSCWMVMGALAAGGRFWLCFTEPSIDSAKTVAIAEPGSEPTLLESFLIDEKRMSLALLVSRLAQRLNGQKWLGPN
ncbi:DUF2996 domain-containing protein [Synechococcus sp. RSCCF101]|uniref:DUF2996 domain-containing protein n=1 Tax=Synechococcus sp. RSCCF101 TaxID=2511069 RepID=UPI0012455AAB|nr:DUF2996 domain-containing protein [Synechococcus sp. RSCCF101]QEY31769.1 DUF2996 domain-containing protein [Synechococcus sp. RSCCF101]